MLLCTNSGSYKKATNCDCQGMLKVIQHALAVTKLWFNGNGHHCNWIIQLIGMQYLASAINLLMCVVKNCLSLCCSSVYFYFNLQRLWRKWFPPGKKQMTGTLVMDPLVLGGMALFLSPIMVGMLVGGHKSPMSLYCSSLSWSWWVGSTANGKLRRYSARRVG